MARDTTFLVTDDIIRGLKNRERPYLKTLYNDYSSKLLGIISMIVIDGEMRLEILEKTFARIYLDIKAYDPIDSSLFIWMMRIALSVSAECMDLPVHETQYKFWEAYKAQKSIIKNQSHKS